MNLKNVLTASLCALALAFSASAGSITDGDGDLIPDVFDNCLTIDNGPGDAQNQVDFNGDGFGNICDGDFDGDLDTDLTDFNLFVADFLNPVTSQFDLDNSGDTGLDDFNIFIGLFLAPPGPGSTAI